MASAFLAELKTVPTEAKRSQIEDAVGVGGGVLNNEHYVRIR